MFSLGLVGQVVDVALEPRRKSRQNVTKLKACDFLLGQGTQPTLRGCLRPGPTVVDNEIRDLVGVPADRRVVDLQRALDDPANALGLPDRQLLRALLQILLILSIFGARASLEFRGVEAASAGKYPEHTPCPARFATIPQERRIRG
jgi:hypothetical protein